MICSGISTVAHLFQQKYIYIYKQNRRMYLKKYTKLSNYAYLRYWTDSSLVKELSPNEY